MKPAVVLLDTKDDRREIVTSLLKSLSPLRRVEFLGWACEFAWLTSPPLRRAGTSIQPDIGKMGPKVERAAAGDDTAGGMLCNEVYLDLAFLSHQFEVDFYAVVIELESWAKGRERTPAAYAARAYLVLKVLKHGHTGSHQGHPVPRPGGTVGADDGQHDAVLPVHHPDQPGQ